MGLKKSYILLLILFVLIIVYFFLTSFNLYHTYHTQTKVIDGLKVEVSIEKYTFFKNELHIFISIDSTQNPEIFDSDFTSFVQSTSLLTDQDHNMYKYDTITLLNSNDYSKKCKITVSEVKFSSITQIFFLFFSS